MLEAVLDHPALRAVDVARMVDLASSHVEYHLEALLDAELLVEATYDHRRFYPASGPLAPSIKDAEWLALLREKVPLHIVLLVLSADGPVTHVALHGQLSIAKSTLSFHLGKLVDAGVLVKEPQGYGPSDRTRLHRLVVRHRPPPDLLGQFFHLWVPLYRDAGRL